MLNTTIITDPYIFILDNVICEQDCNKIIKKYNNEQRKYTGQVGGGVDLNVKNSKDMCLHDTELDWSKEDSLFQEIVGEGHNKYYEHLNNGSNFTFFTDPNLRHLYHPKSGLDFNDSIIDTGYQIQKTEPGKGYCWHDDSAYCKKTGGLRYLTFILYLNTVDEGWTQFYNGDQVSPVAGRLVFFPATWTYVHQGYPPKQTKYIMTGWMHNLIEKKNGKN